MYTRDSFLTQTFRMKTDSWKQESTKKLKYVYVFKGPFLGFQLRQCRWRKNFHLSLTFRFVSFNIHVCSYWWDWARRVLCVPLCIHIFIQEQKKFVGEKVMKPYIHQASIPTLPLRLTYIKMCLINWSGRSWSQNSGGEIETRVQHEVRRRGTSKLEAWGEHWIGAPSAAAASEIHPASATSEQQAHAG